MNTNTTYALIALAIAVLAGSLWYYTSLNIETAHNDALPPKAAQPVGGHEESPPEPATLHQGASIGEENAVEFTCAGGKGMTAIFARDILGLTLSDGRQLEMRQATSGSGIRYLNNTGAIEFRGKGEEAYLQEGDTIMYAECVAAR